MNIFRFMPVLTLLALLAGCATVNDYFDWTCPCDASSQKCVESTLCNCPKPPNQCPGDVQ